MKVVVLGASGGCGREIVMQAHARGDHVVAVGRPSSTLPDIKDIEIKRGEVTDAEFLGRCFQGADVVMSALGLRLSSLAPWARPEIPDLLTRAAPAIVSAAKTSGVSRITAISAGGVGDSYGMMPGFFRAIIRVTALRHVYAELEKFERTLFESGLNILIARPTGLTNGPLTGRVVETTELVGRATIPRADVAKWMLDAMLKDPMPTGARIITVTGAKG